MSGLLSTLRPPEKPFLAFIRRVLPLKFGFRFQKARYLVLDNPEKLELSIFDLGSQGDGVAHANGLTFFVSGALTGERVLVKTAKEVDGRIQAPLLKVLVPCAERREPACPHFPVCGGCRMQHLENDAYLKWKIRRLEHDLAKEGLNDIVLSAPWITPPCSRRRARFAAEHTPKGVRIGFNGWRSHDIVDVSVCAVLLPEITAFIERLRLKLGLWLPLGQSCDIQITALSEGFDVVLMGGPALGLDERQTLAILAEEWDVAQLSWRKWDRSPLEPVAHRLKLSVQYGKTRVPFPPGSFLQATSESEQQMIAFVKEAAGNSRAILDLFSGLGGFGLSMDKAKSVVFADVDGPATEALGRAAKANANQSVQKRNLIGDPFTTGECNGFDTVIFDPPRGGAKAQAANLAHSDVANVIAISCDPPSFARDAKILLGGGYRIKTLLPIDQFLWSTHLELAAHFVR